MMPKIFYVCDRKKCEHCSAECKYTSDITHAANFEAVDRVADGRNIGATNDYFEKGRVSTPPVIYQPGTRQKDFSEPTWSWIEDDQFFGTTNTASSKEE